MRAMRLRLGLTEVELATAMGYKGKPVSLEAQIRRWELGYRAIPPQEERLMLMFDAYGIPKGWRNGKTV
jgi:transcriptional regulator with XRE-family HTH domain